MRAHKGVREDNRMALQRFSDHYCAVLFFLAYPSLKIFAASGYADSKLSNYFLSISKLLCLLAHRQLYIVHIIVNVTVSHCFVLYLRKPTGTKASFFLFIEGKNDPKRKEKWRTTAVINKGSSNKKKLVKP